jgi:F0F1-type ATP synthase epsilon subunit
LADLLELVIRTPREITLDERVSSVRVPSETGQLGIRPRGEPLLTALEPGLVVFRMGAELRVAGTVGGLMMSDRDRCEIFTPFAVVGTEDEVIAALEQQGRDPEPELEARRRLGELEQRIVREIGRREVRGLPHGR